MTARCEDCQRCAWCAATWCLTEQEAPCPHGTGLCADHAFEGCAECAEAVAREIDREHA